MSFLTENPEYLLFAVAALLMLVIVLFIMVTYLTAKYSKLEARFRIFTEGKDGNSLEKMIREAVKASKGLRGEAEEIHKEIDKLKSKTALCYQKAGVYRYDAFGDIGGRLSFTLALLDQNNDGFLISCMHGSEGCYTYLKEVVKGEAFVAISEEEQTALEEALKCEKYE
ncbi:DUF4446 family protein [Cuneatibacter caecimuris]|uniref:Uncharacterized protein DUF4446 n=1 Tax=Cuneatibacter caecimuris TaxID=1796618 RepID=A0A4Q7P3F1_9FIRM|nr:DUF4446 family protein [Cuneatibacter caecimuris]RZS94345.1 uncharacterized protein DUF4446 [Cuneatibacter caecimuris]